MCVRLRVSIAVTTAHISNTFQIWGSWAFFLYLWLTDAQLFDLFLFIFFQHKKKKHSVKFLNLIFNLLVLEFFGGGILFWFDSVKCFVDKTLSCNRKFLTILNDLNYVCKYGIMYLK